MKKTLIIISLLLFTLSSNAFAQLIACRDSIKQGYDFWLYLPENYDAPDVKKPVVMFLHGKSLCGNNLNKVRSYGCIDAITKGRTIDAIVVAPQTSGAWKPEKVMDVFDWVKDHYPADTNRFYVLGMSLGGYGTLDVAASYPDRIAAAMAMCGGASVKELCGLNELPLWIIHGTADRAVPVRCSERVVKSMVQCGDTSKLIFDKMRGVNHSQLARIFYLDQTYDWLFAHSLADSARMVNKDYSISTKIMKDAYSNLDKTFKINIIDSRSASLPYHEKEYYIVKKGDTISKIAVEHQTTVTLLCKLNKLKKTDKLRVGRRIRIR